MRQEKTLRDEFAMAALTSMLSEPQKITESTGYVVAKVCYDIADAMMKQREAK